MSEPTWLSRELVIAMHGESLAKFGGMPGLRDDGMLESALSRPVNKHAYGQTDLCNLAAAYAFGLARNHAFSDGNKRVSLVSMVTFLGLNGLRLTAGNSETTRTIRALADGTLDEDGLADWVRENTTKR